jgi:hypothetical protein
MVDLATDRFTIGVFQDATWAEKGIDALVRHGFTPALLSLVAKGTPENDALAERVYGKRLPRVELKGLGEAIVHGALVAVLDAGEGELSKLGIAATMRRAGFQEHDGVIFERLVDRGGVLVAVSGDARAADALATLHAYGGGNAAIGAWTGRV